MPHEATPKFERVSIRPGVSILSVLRYLNYKPWFALAEFVDNAIQSYLDNKEELHQLHGASYKLKITIEFDSSQPSRITIRDNAAGISRNSFPRAFRPAAIPPDVSGLSEFGMGMKSAACWFSPRWRVRTKALEEPTERIVQFDIANIVQDNIEELEIKERSSHVRDHYTEIVLEELFHAPAGRSIGKIKEHLSDIYRVLIREGSLELRVGSDTLFYEEPNILLAPFYKEPSSAPLYWRKEINFEFGDDLIITGFAALRDPGNYARSGFSLFRRGRLIEGSGEEGYRPPSIFGIGGSSSYARLRLFGELHLEGFEVSHTKDGFRWDDNEEPFLQLLKEHLDGAPLPLLQQCENYRSLGPKKDRTRAAAKALKQVGDALEDTLPVVLPYIAEKPPIETQTEPLEAQSALAIRELRFDFRGTDWLVRIELSDDPAEEDWLSIADQGIVHGSLDVIEIRVSMNHPFMISFAQTDSSSIDPLLRVAAALAISEKLARRAGVKSTGTVRRYMNDLLREALS